MPAVSTLPHTRKRGGIIEYQRQIPARFRPYTPEPYTGKAWFIKSTGKRTLREAAPVHARIAVEFDDLIAAAARRIRRDSPEYAEELVARLRECAARLRDSNIERLRYYIAFCEGRLVPAPEPANDTPVEHVEPIRLADVVFTSADAIGAWIERRRVRYDKPTGKRARASATSKLARLVEFLGHDNLAVVTEDDMERYDEKNLKRDRELGPGGRRDHIMMLQARDCQEFRAEVGHDRSKGARRCRDAKNLAYPTPSSTSCWPEPIPTRFSTLTG